MCPPRTAVAAPGAGSASGADDRAARMGWTGLISRRRWACSLRRRNLTQTVFGVGDGQADWLLVGEAPGAEEDARGEPFVGQAGRLLDAMLAGIGLKRGDDVYIANVLKCRPPGNRNPEARWRSARRSSAPGRTDPTQADFCHGAKPARLCLTPMRASLPAAACTAIRCR